MPAPKVKRGKMGKGTRENEIWYLEKEAKGAGKKKKKKGFWDF